MRNFDSFSSNGSRILNQFSNGGKTCAYPHSEQAVVMDIREAICRCMNETDGKKEETNPERALFIERYDCNKKVIQTSAYVNFACKVKGRRRKTQQGVKGRCMVQKDPLEGFKNGKGERREGGRDREEECAERYLPFLVHQELQQAGTPVLACEWA